MAADPRTVDVPVRRLERWLEGFADRHGQYVVHRFDGPDGPDRWQATAADGSVAIVHAPAWLGLIGDVPDLSTLGRAEPPFGVVLIRRAGYAVGSFVGPRSVERKVGTRHIHGRTAAGGWSQQRYARRRGNQADEIASAVAATASRLLGPTAAGAGTRVQFLVTGGDRPLVADVLTQLEGPAADLPVVAHLGIGTPDAAVLAGIPDRVLCVRIDITDA